MLQYCEYSQTRQYNETKDCTLVNDLLHYAVRFYGKPKSCTGQENVGACRAVLCVGTLQNQLHSSDLEPSDM
jgi:hypothetical protein